MSWVHMSALGLFLICTDGMCLGEGGISFWWCHAMVTWASVIGRHIAWFAGLWGSQSPSWTCQMALNPAHCPLPSHPFFSVSLSISHFYIFKPTATFFLTVIHSLETCGTPVLILPQDTSVENTFYDRGCLYNKMNIIMNVLRQRTNKYYCVEKLLT